MRECPQLSSRRGVQSAGRTSARRSLGGSHDAHEVAAPDPGDVGIAEAPTAQRGGDVAGLGGIHPAGHAARAIEVGGDADVVNADHADQVLNMVHEVFDRRQRVLPLVHPHRVALDVLAGPSPDELKPFTTGTKWGPPWGTTCTWK